MANEHIATYLNDHLAGSVVALELLEHLEGAHADTPLADFFSNLRSEIAADREELESLIGRLHISQSRTRKASACSLSIAKRRAWCSSPTARWTNSAPQTSN